MERKQIEIGGEDLVRLWIPATRLWGLSCHHVLQNEIVEDTSSWENADGQLRARL